MMWRKTWTWMMAVLPAVLLVAAGPSFAKGKGKTARHGGMMQGQGMMQGTPIELSEDQQERLREFHQEHMTEMMNLHAKVRDLNVAIDTELAKDQPNMEKVEQLRAQRAETFQTLAKTMDERRHAVRSVLTDEQKEKLGPCAMGACGMMGGGMMGGDMMGGGMMGGGMMQCPMMPGMMGPGTMQPGTMHSKHRGKKGDKRMGKDETRKVPGRGPMMHDPMLDEKTEAAPADESAPSDEGDAGEK